MNSHQAAWLLKYNSYNKIYKNDPVTQKYDSFYRAKTDNSYNQENLTKEIHSYQNTEDPEYRRSHEYWYSDFVDVTGIDKNKVNLITGIYPNPSNGLVKITSSENIKAVHFVNSTGVIVQVQATIQGKTAWVDTADLPSGVYLVRNTSQQGNGSVKLVVQH